MTAIAATSASSPLSTSGLPAINPATEPEAIRHGDKAAKSAYQQGLAFENVLLNELTQQLTDTVSGGGDDGNGLGGSDDSSSGSSDPAAGAYSSLMPQALSQGIMSAGGGTSLALQIAQGIDPKLALGPSTAHHPSTQATGSSSPTGATGA